VRPRHYSTRAIDIVKGATWRDPERVDEWIGDLSKSEPVVTFCVYGFHIGCETAESLRKAGFDARYMAGGYYAWKASKGPTQPCLGIVLCGRLVPFVSLRSRWPGSEASLSARRALRP